MKRMLPALLTLLLFLVVVSNGTATVCKNPEGEISAQYYGTVGQSVFMHLPDSCVKDSDSDLKLVFKCKDIFRCKNGIPYYMEGCEHHCQFIYNGTLRLDNIMKNLSGIYSFEEFDSDGKLKKRGNISLTIQGLAENIVLPAVLGVCLLLPALLLGIGYLYKKKQKQTMISQISLGDRCEDPQDLEYCQVQVVKKKQRPKKQEEEPKVVYGEVKVSDDSKAVRHTSNEQTDTVYSGIRM